MAPLAEAFVRIRPLHTGFRRETERMAGAAGDGAGENFADRFRRRLTAAMKSLPEATIGVARNDAEQAIKDLRAELARLSDQTVGIDIDAGAAVAEVDRIRRKLAELAADSPDIQVRADTAAAAAQLAGVDAEVRRVTGRRATIGVDVDAGSALAQLFALDSAAGGTSLRLRTLIQVGAALGPAIVPAAAAAAAAISAIGVAAASGLAGIGVTALGFSGIGDAVKALDAAQRDAAKSTAQLSNQQTAFAGSADQVRSAEASLANTRAQAAESSRRSAEQVANAERDLTAAQRDARDVVRELDDARRQAQRRLADMTHSVKENSLAQQQANLDIAEARAELNRVLSDPKATVAQREQARITYEREVLQLQDLQRRGRELAEDTKRANRAGVEGSTEVQAARRRIAQADERVAAAQRQLAEARRSQASQERQAAFSIAQAQQAVANAQRSLKTATVSAGVAGAASMDKLNEAMSKLSPTGQRFARFIVGLQDEIKSLRAAASDGLLPGVQEAIERLLPRLPALRSFIAEVSEALGNMAVNGVRAFESPTWDRFFKFIRTEAVPALQGMQRFAIAVSSGLADLTVALSPFNRDIGGGLVSLAERFAVWASTLESSPGFQRFLAYVAEQGPKVVDLLGELATFAGRLVQAAAPVGSVVLSAMTKLVEVLNAIPLPLLTAFVGVMTAYSVVARTAALATTVWAAATGVQARAQQAATLAMQQYQAAAVSATIATGQTTGALTGIRTASGLAKAGVGGLVGVLGGPLGAAVAGATIAVGVLATASARYHAKIDGLKVALRQLGSAYGDLTKQGKTAAQATDEALRGIVANNPDMQRAVVELDRLGIGFDQLSRAAAGSAGDMNAVLGALDQQIKVLGDRWQSEVLRVWDPGKAKATSDQLALLRQMRKAIVENADALTLQRQAVDVVNGSQVKMNMTAADWIRIYGPLSTKSLKELNDAYTANASKINVLQGLVDAFGTSSATAAAKAQALRAAIDHETGSTVSAIEAKENLRARTLELSDAVKANGATLSFNTQAGLRNRDALEAAASAVRERFLADVASGQPMDEATKRHGERIKALKEEAHRLGLDEKETRKVIAAYGDVPDDVKTIISTSGFSKVFDELRQLQFAQFALKMGLSPQDAAKQWERESKGTQFTGRAAGGPIHGPGTKTSDSVPIMASRGEYMQQAKAVDYYGVGLMHALNQRRIPREALPGYATGGPVAWPFTADVRKTKVMSMEEALSKVRPAIPPGGIGSSKMMGILRRVFPGLPMLSGYREGSRTLTGNLSYHAMTAANGQKGRAVDLPPSFEVFNWLARNYPNARELIFSPAGGRQIWNGRPHAFGEPVRGQHWDHVHWAMAQGGLVDKAMASIPPVRLFDQGGAWPSGTFGYNGSGRTEFVDPNDGRRSGDIHIHVHNDGVIGSQREMDDWLVGSVNRLKRERRLPASP